MLPATGGVVYIREGTYNVTGQITINVDNTSIIGAGYSTQIIADATVRTIFLVNNRNRITFEKLYIYGSGLATGRGIWFNNSTQNSIIKHCWIQNFTHGIDLLQAINNLIIGNFLNSNTQYGMWVEDTCTHNVIANNNITANIRGGLYVSSACSNNIITGNVIKDNDFNDTATYDGIRLSTNCDYNIIANNRCEDNDRYEINILNNTCDKNLVHGNICVGVDHVGAINDAGTGTVSNDNIVA